MRKRKFRKPYRIRRKKPILENRFFWLAIAVFVMAGIIFYFSLVSEFFQVQKIIITGEEKVSKQELKLLIERKIEKEILFFKTKSIFFVNIEEIREDILKNFPQIAEVEIGRGFPYSLNVIVIERLGVAKWCQQENCFLIDSEGVIFEEIAPELDLTEIRNKQNHYLLDLGEKVIEKEYLEKILKIQRRLIEELQIKIKEFIIFSEGLSAKTSEDWEIYFNPKGDIDWQLTKLKAALEEKIPLKERKNLEYIELRFGNLAPYKYRD